MALIQTQTPKEQPRVSLCKHCNQNIPGYRSDSPFCCKGCEFVYALIQSTDLADFYKMKGVTKLKPKLQLFSRSLNLGWLDDLKWNNHTSMKLTFNLSGLECSACTWLIRNLAKKNDLRTPEVNSNSGVCSIYLRKTELEVFKQYLTQVHKMGYSASPVSDDVTTAGQESHSLLARLGILAVCVMNSMIFSFSNYLGLAQDQIELYHLFSILNFILASVAVIVGGQYFFIKTYFAFKSRTFHFDVPISLGIAVSYLSSTVFFFLGRSEHVYFDTIIAFIFLMSVGRFLQQSYLVRFRKQSGWSDDLSQLKIKTRVGNGVLDQPVTELKLGDTVFIPSGGIIPVELTLISPQECEIAVEWITGETNPMNVTCTQTIIAGSQNISSYSIEGKVSKPFSNTLLEKLLVTSRQDQDHSTFWTAYSKYYLLFVFAIWTIGLATGYFYEGWDLALKHLVSLSLLTCPCGIGIAIPVAESVILKNLAKYGVFIRNPRCLETLARVQTIHFDKTGTLALSSLQPLESESLNQLSSLEKDLLYTSTVQSFHPISQAIAQQLAHPDRKILDIHVKEVAGKGLYFSFEGSHYHLGTAYSDSKECQFVKNEKPVATFRFVEQMLDGLNQTFRDLISNFRQRIFILSGDQPTKASHFSEQLNLPPTSVHFGMSPVEKRDFVQKHDPRSSLFVGDGINDTPALGIASVAGVALGKYAQMIKQADFFFCSTELRWLVPLLKLSKTYRSIVVGNIGFSIAYNLAALVLVSLQKVGPLTAAIAMPVLSIVVVVISTLAAQSTKEHT